MDMHADGIIEMLEEEDAENAKKQLESAAIIDVEGKEEEENQACSGQRKESRSGPGSTPASSSPPALGAVFHTASVDTSDLSLASHLFGRASPCCWTSAANTTQVHCRRKKIKVLQPVC